MQDAVSTAPRVEAPGSNSSTRSRLTDLALADWAAAAISAILLILSFPDFDLWPLAWIGLVPLLLVIANRPKPRRSFLLGWVAGTLFFYGSCDWLTFSMINYGGIPRPVAYLLLLPVTLIVGLFPGTFALVLARAIRKWGTRALLVSPFVWVALEWARLGVTGQLWNAIGYSQAYEPALIQTARWGGVYAVGFVLVSVNAALAFLLVRRNSRALAVAAIVLAAIAFVDFVTYKTLQADSLGMGARNDPSVAQNDIIAVVLQPNVPMNLVKTTDEMQELIKRHLSLTEGALKQLPQDGKPRLVIWPESPMNFAYGNDSQLRELLTTLATTNQTYLLLNSQEAAPNDAIYNSAMLVNQQGSLIAQYDKIRLLPFGEYVPLPRGMPGANLISAIVGEFTPGTQYTLMPVGPVRAGVFICIESAYPSIARRFTVNGADVLINISNDGYLGPTAVMRQHLGNAIFRAVENNRPLLRVTNSGITAYITPRGEVKDATAGFQTATRTWGIARNTRLNSFYTEHGDLFVVFCAAISLLLLVASFNFRNRKRLEGEK
ncbi:MAG: apolipoprotein N-acyltransferase [Acidobacteriota bacterium]